MTIRLDAQQLDHVWDASVLGSPSRIPTEDPEELRLFELLAEVDRPTPRPEFFHELERKLAMGRVGEDSYDPTARLPEPALPGPRYMAPGKPHVPGHRWIPAYAMAAVVLLLILSTIAIALPRFDSESERTIPAVSMWVADGPPSSAGVEEMTLFSHTWSADELMAYSFDQWGWLAFRDGIVPPGGRAQVAGTDATAPASANMGMSLMHVNDGALAARLDKPAFLASSNSSELDLVEAGDVTVGAGQTLIFHLGALAELWNPTNNEVQFTTGGAYDNQDQPLSFSELGSDDVSTGISIEPGNLSGAGPIDVALERVVIPPGDVFAYEIGLNALQLAVLHGAGLEQQAWNNGWANGPAQPLSAGTYAQHEDGPGHYTLTNTGSETVEIQLFTVTPENPQELDPSPGVEVNRLFSRTLDQSELEQYQSNLWNWIGMTRGTIAPGQESVIVAGSPIAYVPDYAGLGAIFVEAGVLQASVDAGAWIQLAQGGATEPIAARTTVTLDTGDTLFVPPASLPALWNSGAADANFIAGGAYTSGSSYPLSDTDTNSVHGGTAVEPNDLAIGMPLTMSVEHASIAPGATYSYTMSSETWLLAMVTGDGLMNQRLGDGPINGADSMLVPRLHNLHNNGFGDYAMTNAGSDAVDVYFYRIEPMSEPLPVAAPLESVEILFDQTLSIDQLQEYRFNDWRWIQFDRNTVYPQVDGASSALFPVAWNVVPGLNMMAIETGELVVVPEAEVLVSRGVAGEFESMPPGSEIVLTAGDSMLYTSGTHGKFWNPTDTNTVVVGGGGYLRPESPMFAHVNVDRWIAGQFGQGLTVSPGSLTVNTPVRISITRVSLAPGGSTSVATGPGDWVLASVERGDLEQTTYLDGQQSGDPIALPQGEISLQHTDGSSVELRNVGSGMAVLFVMSFEPVSSDDVA